jgi:alpha-glucosidase
MQMNDFLWWRDGIIYQIYPRSFYDSNGDGLGDLPGITARLDYIAGLGVDAIWLSPFYPSPDQDFGYDISDHTAVDPRFGTLQDFDDLLAAAHARGLKVILDLVLNHTSDQHPWFQQSRSSRHNPYRDWYIWADPAPNGKPPNNWQAAIGGSAWEWDSATEQYYLHIFLTGQPDVNWRNPKLRQAQLDVVRFWLRRGVDGFRLDLFNAYFKDEKLRSNPALPIPIPLIGMKHVHNLDQPEMLPLLNELRAILDEAPGRYAVGETLFPTALKAARYTGDDLLHQAFSFDFTGTAGFGAGWGPTWVRARLAEREAAFQAAGAWPTTVMGNHDVPRPASRYCRGEDDGPAKVAMALLLTARGTPFIYNGDEIGMRDIKLRREQILDPLGKTLYPFYKGRDGCRAPMQWDRSPHGGFSSAAPWLPVHPNCAVRNVEQQSHDPNSLYNFTRSLIRLRRHEPVLQRGEMAFTEVGTRQVLAYTRTLETTTALILLNFTGRAARVSIPGGSAWQVLYSTHRTTLPASLERLTLEAHEVCLLIAV